MSPHDRADRHPLDIALAGVNVAQLAIAVLGVLLISGEYSTGSIRSTFTAVPKRLPVLWAKLARLRGRLVRADGAGGARRASSRARRSSHDIPQLQISFTQPGVARSVLGGARLRDARRDLRARASARSCATRRAASPTFAAIFFVLPPLMIVAAAELEQRDQPVPAERGRAADLRAPPRRRTRCTPLAGGLRLRRATAPPRS